MRRSSTLPFLLIGGLALVACGGGEEPMEEATSIEELEAQWAADRDEVVAKIKAEG